jgi:hypothetical protein
MIAYQFRRKRNERETKEKEEVQPQLSFVYLSDECEVRVVRDPVETDDQKADRITDKGGPLREERCVELRFRLGIRDRRSTELKHQDGHHNREDSITQRFQAGLADHSRCFNTHLCFRDLTSKIDASPSWKMAP